MVQATAGSLPCGADGMWEPWEKGQETRACPMPRAQAWQSQISAPLHGTAKVPVKGKVGLESERGEQEVKGVPLSPLPRTIHVPGAALAAP